MLTKNFLLVPKHFFCYLINVINSSLYMTVFVILCWFHEQRIGKPKKYFRVLQNFGTPGAGDNKPLCSYDLIYCD
jgi:hypothetical protein